jgi:hypothetical protein
VNVHQALKGRIDRMIAQDVSIDIHEREHEVRHHRHEAKLLFGRDPFVAQELEHWLLGEALAARLDVRQHSSHGRSTYLLRSSWGDRSAVAPPNHHEHDASIPVDERAMS